jgi:small subunit ribosomal protein S1
MSEETKPNEGEANDNQQTNEAVETTSINTQSTEAAAAQPAAENVTEVVAQAHEEEETPSDFGAILEQFEQEQQDFHQGDLVRGTVIDINERGVVIDFGYKSEGIVPQEEFMENGTLTVQKGDEIEVLVKHLENSEGLPALSRVDAVRLKAWEDLETANKEGTIIKGRVTERIKGGLRVEIDGVGAFLPGSQLDIRPIRNLDSFINQEVEAKVIKFNRKRANVVLSRKAVLEEKNEEKKKETLAQIEESYIVEGVIKNLTEYGAFVDLGGVDGLLHVTDMSWARLQNPADMFKVGDAVQVKVLKFDREKARVSLGYKQLIPDPWATVEERYPIGKRLKARVSNVTDYGAFFFLEDGLEGLVHVSEMSWSKRVKHPKSILNTNDEVEVEVIGIDRKNRRVSLGMKQLLPNPWDTIDERYQIGTHVRGKVRNLTDFGAFVEVEDGIDGLVHVSDISWSKKVKHPSELLRKGQEVEAVITAIDKENYRLSLSIKDLEPNTWEQFITKHKVGDIVKGKISRFANFGAFVELAEGLEGLCHISELSEERVSKPEAVFQIGQELEFRILRIEREDKKIALSARAVHSDEPIVDTKSYSTEAKGGMASLAELADFFNVGGSSENKE